MDQSEWSVGGYTGEWSVCVSVVSESVLGQYESECIQLTMCVHPRAGWVCGGFGVCAMHKPQEMDGWMDGYRSHAGHAGEGVHAREGEGVHAREVAERGLLGTVNTRVRIGHCVAV